MSGRSCVSFPTAQERLGKKDELAFLPAALEKIVETPPSPTGRGYLRYLIAGAVCPGAAILGKFGMFYLCCVSHRQNRTKWPGSSSYSLSTPALCALFTFHDGQSVRAGEVLIQLDPTMTARAEQEHIRSDLIAAQLNIARLRAALSDNPGSHVPAAGGRQP